MLNNRSAFYTLGGSPGIKCRLTSFYALFTLILQKTDLFKSETHNEVKKTSQFSQILPVSIQVQSAFYTLGGSPGIKCRLTSFKILNTLLLLKTDLYNRLTHDELKKVAIIYI